MYSGAFWLASVTVMTPEWFDENNNNKHSQVKDKGNKEHFEYFWIVFVLLLLSTPFKRLSGFHYEVL